MHLTTNALVLREVNYKESDKILTLLTEAEGKLTVSARGCRKKDSPISSACQLLAWAEFTLYEFKGLWSVKETASERLFEGARADLDKLALASYFAEVTEALAEEGQAEPGLLAVTLNCLHALDKMDLPLARVKAAYEWRAMALAGYEPQIGRCGVCFREQPEEPCIHLGEGMLHCAACRDKLGEGVSMPLTSSALAALRHIVWGPRKRLLSFRLDGEGLQRLSEASEAYLMTRLERGFRTLDFYKQITYKLS
ncbi:MAG: DNA repair protein RecO [Oscillospiraceae bacterium]|jgi:DNA repair protein RecO (recombination protein O)